jgi:hypothetical protein
MRDRTPTTRTPGRAPTPALGAGPALGLALGLVVGLMLGLAGCGSTDPAAPASPTVTTAPTTPVPTSPTSGPTSGPPAMPDAGRQHTKAGAKAFVTYYVDAVDYAQQTLDTAPVEAVSAPTCAGCKAGIRSIKRIARQHGHIEGGHETVSALRSETVMANQSVTLTFDLANEPQRVLVPGKKPVLHPAGTTKMLITLIPRDTGWLASELRGQ